MHLSANKKIESATHSTQENKHPSLSSIGVESATHSAQQNKRPSLSSASAEMKFNRHKKYKQMLPAEKEELLLRRRTRELDSRRHLFQQNRPLIIRKPSVTSKTEYILVGFIGKQNVQRAAHAIF